MTSYRFQVKSRQCFAIFKWITRTYLQHRALCSMLCGSLDERVVWARMNTCSICMAESLRCSPETTTTLLTGYTPIQNKKFKVKKNVNDEATKI